MPYSVRSRLVYSEEAKAAYSQGRSLTNEDSEQMSYYPALHADEIGLTSDKYVPLNASVLSLPLKISYGAMSMQV